VPYYWSVCHLHLSKFIWKRTQMAHRSGHGISVFNRFWTFTLSREPSSTNTSLLETLNPLSSRKRVP
jgi:hypothetical protein